MVGEQLAALVGLLAGVSIGASIVVTARRRGTAFPLLPALFAVLSAAMVISGLVEGDSTASFIGMLMLLFMYSPIWRAGSTALKIAYSLLLIAVSAIFIAVTGIGAISRLSGMLALVGLVGGIASIVMVAKR